MKVRN